jgi:hypothetical protein
MAGVTLEAIGVPAAALGSGGDGRLVVEVANSALALVLGCHLEALVGEPAEALLPHAAVAAWTDAGADNPVETRLGALALPYRTIARPLPEGGPGCAASWSPSSRQRACR